MSAAAILFTAFEPSGDDHASAVIARLRARRPEVPVFAWGGPKMARAGATIIEPTGDDAVMGMPGIEKIREHRRMNTRIAAWLDENPGALLVPVDSPAANFPICALARERGLKVVHLVAPQIWAWGRWRIHKLRRLTDLVLCVLPFEERFFERRSVPSRFIGHPLFDEPLDDADLERRAARIGDARPGARRIALMPGSRPGELRANFPLLMSVFRELRAGEPGLEGVVACTKQGVADQLRTEADAMGGWPAGLHTVAGDTDAAIRWCELAITCSGTVSLQIARQRRPMVIFYRTHPLVYYLIGRWIVASKFLTLPNLVAGREIVPELVPYFGGPAKLVRAARTLLNSSEARETQARELGAIAELFKGKHAADEAAAAILGVLDATTP